MNPLEISMLTPPVIYMVGSLLMLNRMYIVSLYIRVGGYHDTYGIILASSFYPSITRGFTILELLKGLWLMSMKHSHTPPMMS